LVLLQWCRQHGSSSCEWNSKVCQSAAVKGHLHILQWARANGCEWDVNATEGAEGQGNIEILQWCRAQHPPCPWTEYTTAYAATYYHLETLHWLRDNGCPWDSKTVHYALTYGHSLVAQWAIDNGCDDGPDSSTDQSDDDAVSYETD
jgi:hypothetical protein